MNYIEFKNLLEKFRKNECTDNELKDFWEWISKDENESLVKLALSEELDSYSTKKSAGSNEDFDTLLTNIESKIQFSETKKNFWLKSGSSYFAKVAAVLILMFSMGALFSYMVFKPEAKSAVSYCEIKTPLGAKSEVKLSDGSIVWLNAGSKIRYQNEFNKSNRNIILEGEAYFKVAKNENLPFIVKTGGLDIVAVGTEFNVKSYSEEGTVETTLLEGKVKIFSDTVQKNNPVLLLPKQKAVYIKDQQKFIAKTSEIEPAVASPEQQAKTSIRVDANVDPVPIICWKENRLIIRKEELGDLAVKLERKYDITFVFKSENLKHFRFSGTLEDETITQILDVIKFAAPIDYKLEGKTVEIYENCQMTQQFNNHFNRKETN